jgi:ribonuclease-3 family protein
MIGKHLPSPAALAFLGDAVHTLYVRELLVGRGISHSGPLNKEALAYVTATAQAEAMAKIRPHLTEEEQQVYTRAHNTSHINRPKHVSGEDYRAATGFEAILGMLHYLGNGERVRELLSIAYGDITE